MNLKPTLFTKLKSSIQFFDSKPFQWRGMKKSLTYLESTAEYRKAGKEGIIGNQSVAWIEHEVKIYQRSNPISRFIMDVVYQTNQKVRWVNYQKNKEFFETEVKEEPTEEKPQPLSQKEENNPMIESYLFPVSHTTSDDNTNTVPILRISKPTPAETIQKKMLEEFKSWSLKLFKKHHAELHKKAILEEVLSEKKVLSAKRENAYQNQIVELKKKYTRELEPDGLPQCLKDCLAIFNQHSQILEQNLELLVAFKKEMQGKETKTKSETKKTSTTKAVQNPFSRFFNNLFKKPQQEIVNTHREIVVSQTQRVVNQDKVPSSISTVTPSIPELKITPTMPLEAIKKELASYVEGIKTKLNDSYEKICLNLYDLYLCENSIPIVKERKQKEIEKHLEESKKLYRNACVAVHPDKLVSQLKEVREEVIPLYNESFNLLHRFFSRKFADLGKLATDPAVFFANNDVKEVLEKHEKVIFQGLRQSSSAMRGREQAQKKKEWEEFWEMERKESEAFYKKFDESINELRQMRKEFKKELENKLNNEFEAKLEEERKARKKEQDEMEKKQEALQKQLDMMMQMLQSNKASTEKQDSTTEKAAGANAEKTSSSPRLSTARNNFYTETRDSSAEESSTSSTTTLPTDASLSSPSPSLSG